MQELTPAGQNIIQDIARRYNLSDDSAVSMLVAVSNGGGAMAQFSCPELGSGQWMRGGMTMAGDGANDTLKATVDKLCNELSKALTENQMFAPAPEGSADGGDWWPAELGAPSSSGAQNNIRYAFFPEAKRLAVERNGQVSVFKTFDHRIRGVSQQQGDNTSLTFTSQYGIVSTQSLPLISGPGLQTNDPVNFAPATPPSEPPLASSTPAVQSPAPPAPIEPEPGPMLQESAPADFTLSPEQTAPAIPSEASPAPTESASDSVLQESDLADSTAPSEHIAPEVQSQASPDPTESAPGPVLQESDPADFAPPSEQIAPEVLPQASPSPNRLAAGLGPQEIVSLLEKLGQLRDAGVLTEGEFAAKKAELLARL